MDNAVIVVDPNVRTCGDKDHKYRGSTHIKTAVPTVLFRKRPDDPLSTLFKSCLDCRQYTRMAQARANAAIKSQVQDGEFFCSRCGHNKHVSERASNDNGEVSKRCRECYDECKKDKEIRRKHSRDFKLDQLAKIGASCEECRVIIVRDPFDDSRPLILQTVGGSVTWQGVDYDVNTFFTTFASIIVLEVVDFDHLSEEDMRARGKLQPNDLYVPKVEKISALLSDDSRVMEGRKTQILCGKCHVRKTLTERQSAATQGPSTVEKVEYCNGEKLRLGCENCGVQSPDLLQFLEFSHIDAVTKTVAVSTMCYSKAYSLDDVILERNKCRVLCKHCNRMHVRKEGLFKKRKV